MRTSVINRFAKNDRAFSGRRRIAVLAAATVLAGGVQVIAADTGWACGDQRYDGTQTATKPTEPFSDFLSFGHDKSVATDGSWTEFGLSMSNGTGADVARTAPALGLAPTTFGTPLHTKDVRIEVKQNGAWEPLKLDAGCIGIDAETDGLAQPLADHQSRDVWFRISLAPTASKDLTGLKLVTNATNDKSALESWDLHTMKVTHPRSAPAADAADRQAPAGKPAPAKPAAEKTATAEKTAAEAAPTAPTAPATAAPATTAPAGTPELAHTGAAGTDTFLATSSAVLLALGAGVLLAVRRLRRQR
ncbi:hypothetical protein AB0O91_09710 [Kitasatospora sp. NPDC089797]|uniref:hypothetical protein n=1 Tax=Kitasatospora sp. NPDC089797 TaxID=3155298 RepID=UPI00342B90A4